MAPMLIARGAAGAGSKRKPWSVSSFAFSGFEAYRRSRLDVPNRGRREKRTGSVPEPDHARA